MSLSAFSKIWAVTYIVFGLGLLLIPVKFMSTYGVTLESNGIMMTRILGSALTAYAIAFWLNRNIPSTNKAWYNLLLANFIYNILDLPVVFMGTIDGVMNSMGWIPVGLHVFLAVTFGYFTFKKK